MHKKVTHHWADEDIDNDNICKEHLAYKARLTILEENVEKLWGKWDKIQFTGYGILIALIGNLIAVIFMILKIT